MEPVIGSGCRPFWVTEGWPCATRADVAAIRVEAATRYRAARDTARTLSGERWPTELAQIAAQYHVDVTTASRRLGGSW